MGRGLDAILAVSNDVGDRGGLRDVPVRSIDPNPDQPRHRFEPGALEALAGSVKARGVLQPVLLRPVAGGRYQLIAGERRWRAAKLAGLEAVPAIVRDDDAHTLELALMENMAREDLNPVEQARACAALVEELGLTREQVGTRVGKSRVAVSNLMRLLELPGEVLERLEEGQLSEGHGRALLLADGEAERRRLAGQAVAEGWSVRVLEARARKANTEHGAGGAPPGQADGRERGSTPSGDQTGGDTGRDRQAACQEISDLLERALGTAVTVRSSSGSRYTAELSFTGPTEARALASRLAG